MFFSFLSVFFLLLSVIFLFNLNPRQVTEDLISLIAPNDSLAEKSRNLRGGKKRHRIYRRLMAMKTALEVTGKEKQFSVVFCSSVILFSAGIAASFLIDNLFLLPVLSIAFALIPFFCTKRTLYYYEKHVKEELETSLSVISTAYIRSDDIVSAVNENLPNIKPPLKEVFRSFVGEATAVSSNIKRALYNLKEKVDDEIFREWCDTLIQCQDDRTMKDTLLVIVAKLADVRIVNSELKTMLSAARNEYLVMAALVAGNIPLLYVLNKDWFRTLIYTTPGKLTLGICGIVILVTALLMLKFTKPIEYRK